MKIEDLVFVETTCFAGFDFAILDVEHESTRVANYSPKGRAILKIQMII